MPNYKIAVIPGDGTGPEVIAEGLKVLEKTSEICGFSYETKKFDFEGERYLKINYPLSQPTQRSQWSDSCAYSTYIPSSSTL